MPATFFDKAAQNGDSAECAACFSLNILQALCLDVFGTNLAPHHISFHNEEVTEMNRKRTVFIFLAGFWLHEVLTHVWLTVEGFLPLTSNLFGLTITPEMNWLYIGLNLVVFFVLVWFAFFHEWTNAHDRTMPLMHR